MTSSHQKPAHSVALPGGDGKGGVAAVPGQLSGITVYGDGRGCAAADYDGDGRVDLAVGQSGAATRLFHNETAKPGLRVRLHGPAGNGDGWGAQMRLFFGKRAGPIRELHCGGGYLSQDSPIAVLATPTPPSQLWVRWPGGKVTTAKVPAGAREMIVQAPPPDFRDRGGRINE